MPRFHHVNLGVPVGGVADEEAFLVGVLGYRVATVPESLQHLGVHWYDADDGSQVHLSEDPAHSAPARAHVALHYGRELDEILGRLAARHIPSSSGDSPEGLRIVFCRDPAGNRWELRGARGEASHSP